MKPGKLQPYTVSAYNVSHASENKIHDDSVAQKLGFTGGLVPGVEVFGYASHLAVERWGRDWLETGEMDCRFLKPVYDGCAATVTAEDNGPQLDLRVTSEGMLCATGTAGPPRSGRVVPSLADCPTSSRPAPDARPKASPESLPVGKHLTSPQLELTQQTVSDYLRDVRETHPVYASAQLAHPGQILRLCNSALKDNVLLPPWIHTGSKLTNFASAKVGDTLTARARIADNYERKGHRLVDLDVAIVTTEGVVIAHVLHTAVYQLRHLQSV